jgi:uncharacterized protein
MEVSNSMIHVQTVLWRGLYFPGAEYCSLVRGENEVCLEGTAVVSVDQRPYAARYRILCDLGWSTRFVEVGLRAGPEVERTLTLVIDEDHRWQKDGIALAEVSGCVDVDLGFSPATNTLPIRRLNLPVGSAREVTAGWVKFPDLDVRPLRQRYSRLSAATYLYESLESGFRAEIEVDETGMVLRYGGGWERIAQSGG